MPDIDNFAAYDGPRQYSYKIITSPAVERWWPANDPRESRVYKRKAGLPRGAQEWPYEG